MFGRDAGCCGAPERAAIETRQTRTKLGSGLMTTLQPRYSSEHTNAVCLAVANLQNTAIVREHTMRSRKRTLQRIGLRPIASPPSAKAHVGDDAKASSDVTASRRFITLHGLRNA